MEKELYRLFEKLEIEVKYFDIHDVGRTEYDRKIINRPGIINAYLIKELDTLYEDEGLSTIRNISLFEYKDKWEIMDDWGNAFIGGSKEEVINLMFC